MQLRLTTDFRRRCFREKISCYRKYPNIAGTVYFCLNDYRTQMGEDGQGKLRKRVHGSTGLCGEPKPSYYTVRKEYSPIILETDGNVLKIRCRNDFPCYSVKGYVLQLGGRKIAIPDMKPGDVWRAENISSAQMDEIEVYRPGGERVL